jgi:hypothetical protein
MIRSQRSGNRYLAMLVMVFALAFFAVGTLGPAHHSPYYAAIVPLPAAIALILGWRAWSNKKWSAKLSAGALILLIAVLGLSHLLPRSHP